MSRETTSPLKTYQLINSIRRILTDSFLQKTYKVEMRQIHRWSCDPNTSASHQANPLDRIELILDRLMEVGREDIARAIVARMAHIVGCELRILERSEPNKDTIAEECCDDIPPLGRFHQVLLDPSSPPEKVRAAWQEAKQELDQDYELYIRRQKGQ